VEESWSYHEIGGCKTRVLETGSGQPVVVLHGWGGRIESMTPVLRCLSEAFRVVAIDLPGFGDSSQPLEVWGTPEYARHVGDVMDELLIDRADFVGHSFGAKVALYLAAWRPRSVGKLVVQGSSGLLSDPTLRVRFKRIASRAGRVVGRFGASGERVKRALFERIQSRDYEEAGPLRPTLVKVVNEDIAPLLPSIRSSTLLVWGTEDDAVPLAHARRMEALIPDAGLIPFEGAGHFAYLEEPERFCRITRHFLGVPVA
jgi:pimeloyl-ACP methyl ester carboxylesterase